MFTDEELDSIAWLASLVKSQALSERDQANRSYMAYSDRSWAGTHVEQARSKHDRAQSVLDALKRERA